MTDRYDGLTVVFSKDMRSDDAQGIIDAIKMLKGVADVAPVISTTDGWAAAHRTKLDLLQRLQGWIRAECMR